MAGAGVVDLALFYSIERLLFNKLVGSMGKNAEDVKSAMSMWLVLEEIGYSDLIRTIHSYSNDVSIMGALLSEAMRCVDQCIHPDPDPPAPEPQELPIFSTLVDDPINLTFFHYNRLFLHRRYLHVMHHICNKIFEFESDTPNIAISTLNPYAPEFNPREEDARTLFLTFSKGYPLTRQQIITFFTSNWGNCVEHLYMDNSNPPQFGRIVLTTTSIANTVLNHQKKAEFKVNNRDLWARRYYHER